MDCFIIKRRMYTYNILKCDYYLHIYINLNSIFERVFKQTKKNRISYLINTFVMNQGSSILAIKQFFVFAIGRRGRIMKQVHIMRCFGLFCVHSVYYLRKSTEFCDIRTECQIIIIYFLLIASHQFREIDKCQPLPYSLLGILSPIAIDIDTQLMVYIKRRR